MMAALPTTARGVVDSTQFGSVVYDAMEHIPDLQWPGSVPLYGQMARDPQIAAILASYTLQLRHAAWQVDATGCRPEVARLVADDLGLPVAGDDGPGAARTRGVSWQQHLRAALSMLTFGHSCFELLADATSGTARLVALSERMQHTLSDIKADEETGDLIGVSQTGVSAGRSGPQITADRLLFYSRDRRGVTWQGESLLRPAYPYALIKREMLRVHASANRRWGLGVPVMEALPGTAPTSEQMREAMAFAAAARAGDQSGGASPPGFAMRILGITGTVPDTQAFLRWLDAQMSRSVLASHLDLGGESSHGSYSLATSFVDLLMLALRAIGDEIADTVTRQVAARLVGWNWGDGEPVPRVVVSGVGSRREVTAESLQLLLSSGALAGDPGLEAWVRREWRLPERDGQERPVAEPGVDLPASKPAEASKPAAQAITSKATACVLKARRRPRPGQLPLFQGAAVEDLQPAWEQTKTAVLDEWADTIGALVDDLEGQVQQAESDDDPAALAALVVTAAAVEPVTDLLTSHGVDLAETAREALLVEAAEFGHTLTVDDPAATVETTAGVVAALIAGVYAATAAKAALLSFGAGAAMAAREAMDELTEAGKGTVADHVGGFLTGAQNAGRTAVMAAAETAAAVTGYRASEVNDKHRCGPCGDVNGREYESLADGRADYPTLGYRACEGRWRCRGALVPIWI